jgi:hypothetical protein
MTQSETGAVTAAAVGFDVSTQEDVAKLKKGAVGLGGVLFLTLTGSAPITAMLLNVPLARPTARPDRGQRHVNRPGLV